MEFLLFQLNERVALLQQTNDELLAEIRGKAVQETGERKKKRLSAGRSDFLPGFHKTTDLHSGL